MSNTGSVALLFKRPDDASRASSEIAAFFKGDADRVESLHNAELSLTGRVITGDIDCLSTETISDLLRVVSVAPSRVFIIDCRYMDEWEEVGSDEA